MNVDKGKTSIINAKPQCYRPFVAHDAVETGFDLHFFDVVDPLHILLFGEGDNENTKHDFLGYHHVFTVLGFGFLSN